MRNADKPNVVIICGDNNKVSFREKKLLPIAIVVFAIAIVILAISLCCPELLADFVRYMIGIAVNS